jgi:hypothetical protein
MSNHSIAERLFDVESPREPDCGRQWDRVVISLALGGLLELGEEVLPGVDYVGVG